MAGSAEAARDEPDATPSVVPLPVAAPLPTDCRVYAIRTDAAALGDELAFADDRGVLDADELARGARFRDPLRGRAWMRVRASLRRLLAAETVPSRVPVELRFVTGPAGKPALAPVASSRDARGRRAVGRDTRFNVSHATGLSLIGLSGRRALGIDVERCDRVRDPLALAALVCSPAERDALAALPPDARHAAFARLWARKEAFVKADGAGLGFGLDRVHVGLGDPGRAMLDGAWRLVDVAIPGRGDLVAAICIEDDSYIKHGYLKSSVTPR